MESKFPCLRLLPITVGTVRHDRMTTGAPPTTPVWTFSVSFLFYDRYTVVLRYTTKSIKGATLSPGVFARRTADVKAEIIILKIID